MKMHPLRLPIAALFSIFSSPGALQARRTGLWCVAVCRTLAPAHETATTLSFDSEERKNTAMANNNKETLVVGSKVRDVIRQAGMRSDGELVSAVSEKVHQLLQQAIVRCKSNNRSTVRPHDV